MGKGRNNGFSDDQLEVYRECFRLMDVDKDGVINKNDLRAAFDNVGRLMSDAELDSMLAEIGGPCNCENMIRCFEAKMAGGVNDPDEVILKAFKLYDEEVSETVKGVTTVKHLIDTDNFRHVLMTFGDKLTQDEIDDIFGEFDYDEDNGGAIFTKSVVDLFVAGGMDEKPEEKKEEQAPPSQEAQPDATPTAVAAEGGKKKKKKKKAAK